MPAYEPPTNPSTALPVSRSSINMNTISTTLMSPDGTQSSTIGEGDTPDGIIPNISGTQIPQSGSSGLWTSDQVQNEDDASEETERPKRRRTSSSIVEGSIGGTSADLSEAENESESDNIQEDVISDTGERSNQIETESALTHRDATDASFPSSRDADGLSPPAAAENGHDHEMPSRKKGRRPSGSRLLTLKLDQLPRKRDSSGRVVSPTPQSELDRAPTVDRETQELLECPVCQEIPRTGSIYQCNNGHTIVS